MAIITKTIHRARPRKQRAELAQILQGLAMGFAGGIFAMVVFVGISEWIRILGA